MASNAILTDSVITKEALRILHNTLGFVKGLNREYSSQFAQTGGKIGQSINVRKPNRYTVQQGPAINPQGTTESTVPLTLDRQWVVPMSFSSKELTLHIDEFSKRYIAPAVAKLASTIDLDCALAAITGKYSDGVAVSGGAGLVPNIVGTPGTTAGTKGGSVTGLPNYNAPEIFLNAGLLLDNEAAARDNGRTICLNPAANATSVSGLSGLFNPQGIISDQYRNGMMGNALGFDFTMDQNMPTYSTDTALSGGSPTATITNGSSTVALAGLGQASGTIKAGTIFNVATVYGVNPENQQSTGILRQFVVTADATISGNAVNVTVFPTPKVIGATVPDGTVTNAATTQAVTFLSGTAATTSFQQSLAFHKEAFTLGTADLELPGGVSFAARETHDGLSMRILRDYDIMNDFMVCRIDVLGGFAALRPELAVRITN